VRRIVDLSMPVHMDMLTFPRVPPPALTVYESHEQFAQRIGAAEHGVESLTASYLVVQNDHVGTHLDARKHIVPDAGGPETIPLEYCLSDGVLLDFRDKASGDVISVDDVKRELERIEYTLKERDIVLNHTGAGAYNTEERYRTDHPGMSGDATRWLISQGVRLMGCDAITYDPPVWAMFEKHLFWEAHRVMWDEEYWHLENLMNLEQIGRPHGFQVSVLPVKWVGTTAAPVRAVAVVEDGDGA
jgi:kynurenine formamidase